MSKLTLDEGLVKAINHFRILGLIVKNRVLCVLSVVVAVVVAAVEVAVVVAVIALVAVAVVVVVVAVVKAVVEGVAAVVEIIAVVAYLGLEYEESELFVVITVCITFLIMEKLS